MVNVSILAFKDTFGTSFYPAITGFEEANNLMLEMNGKEMFNIQVVGYKNRTIRLDKRTTLRCDAIIDDPLRHDLILVPAVEMNSLPNLDFSYYNKLGNWLKLQHQKGAKIGSMCTGSFLLAHAGLLEQQPCTTHWMGVESMRNLFPAVCMQPDKAIVQRNNIYTAGGAFTSNQLILHFIEHYCGKEVAIFISKMAGIDYPIKTQTQFYIFNQQKKHQDDAVLTTQNYMEKHYADELKIDELAKKVNMSTRNFIRRFKKATDETPIQYLQKIRIEVAKKTLEAGQSTIFEVMYNIGYSDMKSFSVLFKRLTGLTPAVYAKKFGERRLVA